MPKYAPSPAAGGKLPPCEDMKRLRLAEGWTYRDFQDTYDVTSQAVYKKLERCGLTSGREDYSAEVPWTIRPEDRFSNTLRLLRVAARDRRGTLEQLSPAKRREYDNFRDKLQRQNVVVGYGPYLDEDGERRFGFYFAPCRPGVDNWIIREPQRRRPSG